MDRSRIIALVLGLATIVLMCVVGFLMTKPWFPAVTVGLPAQAALGFFLMTIRSWMKDPMPRQPCAAEPPTTSTKDTTFPGVLLLIALGSVVAMTPYALSCKPAPTLPPNPPAGNCLADRLKDIGDCIKNNATKAEIDACRATKVRDCTDGGIEITTTTKEGGV